MDDTGLKWRKASKSGNGGNCVEVASAGSVHIRDTKSRERGMLTVSAETWRAFIAEIKTSALQKRAPLVIEGCPFVIPS
jgi:hypothetical protein